MEECNSCLDYNDKFTQALESYAQEEVRKVYNQFMGNPYPSQEDLDQTLKSMDAIRNKALDEAVKVADKFWKDDVLGCTERTVAQDIAKAIAKLKDSP